ncbi:hypothetical protein BH23BAC1_BH23BAC1_51370 [soil metagenome]
MKIDRNEWLNHLRPKVKRKQNFSNDLEMFLELTLKPITEFQTALLVFGFKTFLKKSSSDFVNLTTAHQKTFINDRLRSDPLLKNSFINYTVALFDSIELEFYTKNRLEVRRLIIELTIAILENHLDHFNSINHINYNS